RTFVRCPSRRRSAAPVAGASRSGCWDQGLSLVAAGFGGSCSQGTSDVCGQLRTDSVALRRYVTVVTRRCHSCRNGEQLDAQDSRQGSSTWTESFIDGTSKDENGAVVG